MVHPDNVHNLGESNNVTRILHRALTGLLPALILLPSTLTAATDAIRDLAPLIRQQAEREFWTRAPVLPPLTDQRISHALEAARAYYIGQQRPEGNFWYAMDLERKRKSEDDNQVRQGLALWGFAALCTARPTPSTQTAVLRGLDHFFRQTQAHPSGAAAPVYGDDPDIATATVAAVSLAMLDFASRREIAATATGREIYTNWLNQYLEWLEKMENGNGSWAVKYITLVNQRDTSEEPFTDALCLLAYERAVKRFGYTDLQPKADQAAQRLACHWLQPVLTGAAEPQTLTPCLAVISTALAEYAEAGGSPDAELYGDLVLALAWRYLYQVDALRRERTLPQLAALFVQAARVAKRRGNPDLLAALRSPAETLLSRALLLQVRGPYWEQNTAARSLRSPANATGGFLLAEDGVLLRIDAQQAPVQALLDATGLFAAPPAVVASPSP